MIITPYASFLFRVAVSLRTNSQRRHGRFSQATRHGDMPWTLSVEGRGGDHDHSAAHDARDVKDQPSLPSQAELDVLRLAQSHFASQALLAVLRLGVLDVLDSGGDKSGRLVDDIITQIMQGREEMDDVSINRDALFRCLRLLCTTGVIQETTKNNSDGIGESAFSLTEMGQLLRRPRSGSDSSMSSFALHWADPPLWNAWSQLPDYVAGNSNNHGSLLKGDETASRSSFDSSVPPFDRANGMSASDYYENKPDSRSHRNAVAKYASSKEITSIVDAMQKSPLLNESVLNGKTIVDVGGGYGDLMYALKRTMPSVGTCYCLDLPDVIEDASSMTNNDSEQKSSATLVAGNMFDPSTIPPCDLIFTKHVLCDFSDEDVIRALQSFRMALSKEGKVVILDAVLPNGGDLNGKWNAAVSFDVLLMLSGRRGERSRLEWSNIAEKAGFALEDALPTSSVTVDLAILSGP